MARKCTICEHPNIEEINTLLVKSSNLNDIVTKYNDITKMSLIRHQRNHLPKTLVKDQEVREVVQADNLLSQINNLHLKAMGILDEAERVKDLRAALAAIREIRGILELLAKLALLSQTSSMPGVTIIDNIGKNRYSYMTDEELDAELARLDMELAKYEGKN